MFELRVGQELEFIAECHADGRFIAKGTRVRVGQIMPEVVESKITLVILGQAAPITFTADRHVVTMNCRVIDSD